jgi:hypothetical protein
MVGAVASEGHGVCPRSWEQLLYSIVQVNWKNPSLSRWPVLSYRKYGSLLE